MLNQSVEALPEKPLEEYEQHPVAETEQDQDEEQQVKEDNPEELYQKILQMQQAPLDGDMLTSVSQMKSVPDKSKSETSTLVSMLQQQLREEREAR